LGYIFSSLLGQETAALRASAEQLPVIVGLSALHAQSEITKGMLKWK